MNTRNDIRVHSTAMVAGTFGYLAVGASVELTQLPRMSRPSLIRPEPSPVLGLCDSDGGSP